ncbi:hypothetical protein scyTo_0009874 [Scyliorhinus torazame]|uniref:G-protein coupled receptors family 2 profile 2 domain-containing protein n=1 Tax=Scyliorhinus torazame TaxID=75743 RepID=A0A401NVA5_SCYTO|nr:hypothetical protein [Scyliorhinus torazame]
MAVKGIEALSSKAVDFFLATEVVAWIQHTACSAQLAGEVVDYDNLFGPFGDGSVSGLPGEVVDYDNLFDPFGDGSVSGLPDNEDLDSKCGPHARYYAAYGDFYCTCEKGYIPTSGKAFFADGTGCRSVAAVGFIAYGNLESILDGDFVKEEKGKGEKMGGSYKLNSDVVTVTTGDRPQGTELPEPVNFTLRHKEETNSDKIPVCVHWENGKERSFWSPKGCKIVTFTENHTTCGCLHLANFAILMAPVEMEDSLVLHIISLIGISLSLICLAISTLTFAFCRSIQRETRTIHMNLCLSLFLALLFFVTGISRTGNKVLCAVIAGVLYYFFLVAFAWMFLEGLHLFLIVKDLRKVKVSQATVIRNVHLYAIGYILPAVVLGILVAAHPSGFGTSRHCWLQLEKGFIWSFLGPVFFIILVNTALLLSVLFTLHKQLSGLNSEVSKIKDTRMLTFKAIAQVFILGCTWILGLLHFGKESVVMSYVSTITNSLQGTFIFIILCVLNKQVRKEYRKCFGGMKKASFWSESASTSVVTATQGGVSAMESKV